MMLYVNNRNEHDPALNLALEEYLLRNAQASEDLLLLYINEPSIIIGRHQNAFEEINRAYVGDIHFEGDQVGPQPGGQYQRVPQPASAD